MPGIDFYTYARDADNALELAGHGAGDEFRTLEEAIANYDEFAHVGRPIFKVSVEQVADPVCEQCRRRHHTNAKCGEGTDPK